MLTAQEIDEWDQDPRIKRIADIDKMFADAKGWGSWMVAAANEREDLVNQLNALGHNIEHKHLARTESGGRVT